MSVSQLKKEKFPRVAGAERSGAPELNRPEMKSLGLRCAQPPATQRRTIQSGPVLAALAAVVCAGWFLCSPARAQTRLFEQEPYDLITLDRANGGKVLKVMPLPQRRLPEKPAPRSKLRVHLLEDPATPYDISWTSIDREKTKLFEELVLDEANRLVAAKKLDAAYDYFKFLEEKDPQLPALAESIESYLIEEFRVSHARKRYADALAILWELHRRNPDRDKLDKALGMATDLLVQHYRTKEDYRSARQLLDNLAAAFPRHQTVAKHRDELRAQAAELLVKARKEEQAADFRAALQTLRQLMEIWPELPEAKQFGRSLHQRYPRVVVGVSVAAADARPGRLNGWADRRSGRLLYRTLTEFAGPSTEGGNYRCPVGQLIVDEFEGRLTVEIRPNILWSAGGASLTGYDVSRRLLAMTEPGHPAYRIDWAELLAGVSVSGVYEVDVELHRPHVRPDALLQTMLVPYATPGAGSPLPNGPYVEDRRTGETIQYAASGHYFASTPTQPKEIVERRFARGTRAIEALRRGDVHVLDRVNPWRLEIRDGGLGLKGAPPGEDLVVARYRLPLVHCLIPNMRKPLPARRTFRRALAYGIHREAILDHLTGGSELPGCRLVSGPFPAGIDYKDPIRYAYHDEIEPRIYDPRLAIALATVAVTSLAEAKREQGESLTKMPRLVLAHPRGEIVRVACASIKQQLELVGIPIELRPFEGPAPEQVPEDVDLLYTELAIWEPVIDARRVLGEDGLAAGCSPYMSLALRQLELAAGWQEVSATLHRIHRIAHDDVAVVPLWQMTDHLAYHKSLSGIGPQPVLLYEDVEQWQVAFEYPADEK